MSEINHKALDVVRSLGQAGKQDLLQRLVNQYLADIPTLVEAILAAVEQGDFDGIRTSAHSAKSSSAYVGAQEFSKRLAQIEHSAREHDLLACKENCDGLFEHLNRVEAELYPVIQDKAA